MSIPVPQAQNNLDWHCTSPLKPGSIHLLQGAAAELINPSERRCSVNGHMTGRANSGIVGPIPAGQFLLWSCFALGIALHPLFYPSTKLQDNACVSPRGGNADSLQVTSVTCNLIYIYGAQISTFKKIIITFPHLVNDLVQNYNIQNVIKNILNEENLMKKSFLMEEKPLVILNIFPRSYKKYSKI